MISASSPHQPSDLNKKLREMKSAITTAKSSAASSSIADDLNSAIIIIDEFIRNRDVKKFTDEVNTLKSDHEKINQLKRIANEVSKQDATHANSSNNAAAAAGSGHSSSPKKDAPDSDFKATLKLAKAYVNGEMGAQINYEKAVNLWILAASRSNILIDQEICHQYLFRLIEYLHTDNFKEMEEKNGRGIGREKACQLVLDYFNTEAKNNNADALYQLGNIYIRGFGVKQDIEKVKEYHFKAMLLGHEEALRDLLSRANFDKNKVRHRFYEIIYILNFTDAEKILLLEYGRKAAEKQVSPLIPGNTTIASVMHQILFCYQDNPYVVYHCFLATQKNARWGRERAIEIFNKSAKENPKIFAELLKKDDLKKIKETLGLNIFNEIRESISEYIIKNEAEDLLKKTKSIQNVSPLDSDSSLLIAAYAMDEGKGDIVKEPEKVATTEKSKRDILIEIEKKIMEITNAVGWKIGLFSSASETPPENASIILGIIKNAKDNDGGYSDAFIAVESALRKAIKNSTFFRNKETKKFYADLLETYFEKSQEFRKVSRGDKKYVRRHT